MVVNIGSCGRLRGMIESPSPFVVVPVTSQIHSDTFAKALGWDVSTEPEGTHWALFVGGAPNQLAKKFKDAGSKTACYWIGSDSLQAQQQVAVRKNIDVYDVHLCVHQRIKQELEAWGVRAEVVWPCARNLSVGLGPTQEKLVGVYMPEPSMYMFEECKQVARENPDIPFVFYGAMFEMGELPANVKDAGRMAPEETSTLTDRMSCMLRLVRHDGNPVSGIEMKQRNRHVIENYPYDGFLYAYTMDDVNRWLRDPKTHQMDESPWGALYRERCSRTNFKKEVLRICGLPL